MYPELRPRQEFCLHKSQQIPCFPTLQWEVARKFSFESSPDVGLARSFRLVCGIISPLLTPNFVAGHPGRVLPLKPR